jgi:hypothetical protein
LVKKKFFLLSKFFFFTLEEIGKLLNELRGNFRLKSHLAVQHALQVREAMALHNYR